MQTKKKVYVIKANGIIERASRSVFTKNVRLEPGDTIVVPRRIIVSSPLLNAVLPVTSVLSDGILSCSNREPIK